MIKRGFIRKSIFYLLRIYLCIISIFRLLFFPFYIPAVRECIRKILLALFEYYRDTTMRVADFEQSAFYKERKNKLCWCKISILSTCWGNVSEHEVGMLATIVAETYPQTVFEFGTYNGYTAIHLANNVSKDTCKIYTLDLPLNSSFAPRRLSLFQAYDDALAIKAAGELVVASLIPKTKHKNIIQLFGDSLVYDFSPWYRKIDVCFVDACHSYEYVKRDTENAFKMLSARGVLIWHDFDINHYDVFRYINKIAKTKKLFRIRNTTLVVYFNL